MTDLLTLGWPWFAATIALGAIIGFFATSDAKNASSAPGWVFLALVAALLIGALLSAGGLFQGRDAVSFDIGLLAFGGYTIGLPVGRMLKLAGAQSESDAKRAAPQLARPIIAPVEKPAPAEASIATSEASAATSEAGAAPLAALPEPTPEINIDAAAKAARELSEKVAKLRAPSGGKSAAKGAAKSTGKAADKSSAKADKSDSKYPGAQPATFAAARGGAPDDLSLIKGLGPKSVEKLHKLGVFHYDQIADWSADNAKWIGAAIGAAGRVERDNWVAQARKLTAKAASNAA